MFPDHYEVVERLVFEQVRELPLQAGAEGYGPLYDLEIVKMHSHVDFNDGQMTRFVVQGKRDLIEAIYPTDYLGDVLKVA